MTLGLLARSLRQVWPATLILAATLLGFEALLARILPTFFTEFADTILQVQFIAAILKTLLGVPVDADLGTGAIGAFVWVHPVVLALVWAQAILVCTRVPAGEVDRGTIDVLLGLPVSRVRLFTCEAVVWLGSGLLMVLMGLIGHLIGRWTLSPAQRTPLEGLAVIAVNLYCLYVAVGGCAAAVSAVCDSRGRAVGIVFGMVVASFFLTFLGQFWAPAQHVTFLSVLNYYQPLHIQSGGGWPVGNILVLTCVGLGLWLCGAAVFARRDICTT